jgi:lysine-N-methylase
MQLTQETVTKYERDAPELLDAVTSGEAQFIMKRDPVTDQCVKFDQGWCGIHQSYGDAFLGDACHFFPRITRAVGTTLLTSATLSCPETARLMLYDADGFALGAREEVRTPYSLRNYLPDGMDADAATSIHATFMALAGQEDASAARNLMRVSTVARALELQPVAVWPDAIAMYASMADSRIPAAEMAVVDPFNLIHALHGLIIASPSPRARLMQLVQAMMALLGIDSIEGGAIRLADNAAQRASVAVAKIRAQEAVLQPVLRRYVQAQLSQALFPFSGFGETLSDRVGIIGVRFATTRLALATLAEKPAPEEVVRVVQTLARFMDHLADPTMSLQVYRETGWLREPRLRALILD